MFRNRGIFILLIAVIALLALQLGSVSASVSPMAGPGNLASGLGPGLAAPTPTRAPAKPGVSPRGILAPPGNWITDFTLFNQSSSVANVTLTRFVQFTSGASADAGTAVSLPDSGCGANKICAKGSAYYNPATDSTFPTNFGGSIVVSSDQQLAGTVTAANTSTGTAYASDAYSAVTNPSTSVILPIIMSHLGVWNTAIYVQNAGSANTNVTVHYVGSGAPADTTITNLPPNMTAVVDQASLSTTGFNGSAVVSGAQNLAVIVEEYKTTGGVLVAYNGLASSDAGQTVYMPGYIATGVWATDFTVVNTTGSLANVTVKFSGFSGQLNGSIPANGSAYINPRAGVIPSGWSGTSPTSGYYGAATVTSSQNVVVVYNISNSFGGPGNSAIGYTGFSSSKAALTKVVPLIENMYSTGWVTTFSVQSVDGTPANLTLTYSPAKGSCNGSCTKTYNMTSTDAGAHTFNQASDGHISAGFLGGVTITSNKNIVVIADQNNATASQYQGGDAAAGFAGF